MAPSPPGPYCELMRRMANRMQRLQDELAVESRTNIEFEEASRRSFDFLAGQVTVLKEAFNKLTDCMMEELELMGSKLDQRMADAVARVPRGVDEAFVRDATDELASRVRELQLSQVKAEGNAGELESRMGQLSKDMDAVLSVIPKLEDKIDAVSQDVARVSQDVARLGDSVAARLEETNARFDEVGGDRRALAETRRLESELRRLDAELREDLEQRHLRLQRNITRQLESMSKVVMEANSSPTRRSVDFHAGHESPAFSTAAAPAVSPGLRPSSLRNVRIP